MNRLELTNGTATWTQPDSVKIALAAPATVNASAH
jgi:hypothetical protein